jgi:hypothetical protein
MGILFTKEEEVSPAKLAPTPSLTLSQTTLKINKR